MERAAAMPPPAYMKLLDGNRARVSGAPSLTQEPPTSPHSAEASRAGTPTEEPKPAPTEKTPKKSGRAPKDDLDFYID